VLPQYARSLPAGPRFAPLPRDKFPTWVQLPQEVRLKIYAHTEEAPYWSKKGTRPGKEPLEILALGREGKRVRDTGTETGWFCRYSVEIRVDLLANDTTLKRNFISWIAEQRRLVGVAKSPRNKGARDRKPRWGYLEELDKSKAGDVSDSSTCSKVRRWPVNPSFYFAMRWIVEVWKKEQALLYEPIDLTIPFLFNKKFRASKRGNAVSPGKRPRPPQARGKQGRSG